MTTTLRRTLLLATTMTMLPMIAACSRSAPEPAPEESVTESRTVETRPPPPPLEAPPPPAAAANVSAPEALAIPPEAPIAEDEQMREDADAVGMTARAARDEALTPPDDDAAANATGTD